MDSTEVMRMALEELDRDLYSALDELTPEEIAWQPSPEANPIGFLVWHMTRAEDNWLHRFAEGQPPIWERDGWHSRFNLPAEHSGYSYTLQQLQAFPQLPLQELLGYHEAVRQETVRYLQALSQDDLEKRPQADQRPERTIGWMISHVICEVGQHVGHVRYVRGLQRGLNK